MTGAPDTTDTDTHVQRQAARSCVRWGQRRPEEVLEPVRSAPERYETVRTALRFRDDGTKIKEVRERFLHSEAGARLGALRKKRRVVGVL